jgi:hypothetical protein
MIIAGARPVMDVLLPTARKTIVLAIDVSGSNGRISNPASGSPSRRQGVRIETAGRGARRGP